MSVVPGHPNAGRGRSEKLMLKLMEPFLLELHICMGFKCACPMLSALLCWAFMEMCTPLDTNHLQKINRLQTIRASPRSYHAHGPAVASSHDGMNEIDLASKSKYKFSTSLATKSSLSSLVDIKFGGSGMRSRCAHVSSARCNCQLNMSNLAVPF